jgi:hypothetical protein
LTSGFFYVREPTPAAFPKVDFRFSTFHLNEKWSTEHAEWKVKELSLEQVSHPHDPMQENLGLCGGKLV